MGCEQYFILTLMLGCHKRYLVYRSNLSKDPNKIWIRIWTIRWLFL